MKAPPLICLLLPLLLANLPATGQPIEQQEADSLLAVWNDAGRPDTARFEALYVLMKRTYHTMTPDSMVQLCETLFVFAEKRGLRSRMNRAKCAIGNGYYLKGDFLRARTEYAAALALVDGPYAAERKSPLNGLSLVCMAQGDIAQAIEYQTEALHIAEMRKDTAQIITLLGNIGTNHSMQSDHATAIQFFERSLVLAERTHNERGISSALTNLGITQWLLGEPIKALEAYERCMGMAERAGDRRSIAHLSALMATVRNQLGGSDQALELIERALGMNEEQGDSTMLAMNLVTLGAAYQGQGRLALAARSGERALGMAKRLGYLDAVSKAASLLYDVYKAQGNDRGALAMYELHISSRDSIANDENKQKMLHQKYNYEFEKKEALLQADQAKRDAVAVEQLRRKNVQRNAFVGGFALMLLLAGTFLFQRNRISKEKARSEELLLNILPEEVAEELKAKGAADARQIDQVTVLFTDFKGFTAMSEQLGPKELVRDIHECFSAFDRIMEKHGIEKIKTIGDAYMAAGGLPTPNTTHAVDVVRAALEIRDFIVAGKTLKIAKGLPYFEIRIGVHTGPVVAGIVGVKKFAYDIWGDTVNIASRMESSGEVGQVNISEATYALVKDAEYSSPLSVVSSPSSSQATDNQQLTTRKSFTFTPRGKVQAKGKGELEMYFVEKNSADA